MRVAVWEEDFFVRVVLSWGSKPERARRAGFSLPFVVRHFLRGGSSARYFGEQRSPLTIVKDFLESF